ncbi:MAG: DNA polymerase III subunit beta [Rhizobiaceae bacterium]|nr:DNA polymerase III subunit beta [Rhizobiaceae bacterium]
MSGFTVERNEFLDALAATKGAVARTSTIPILNNILLRVRDGALHITATDLEIQVEATCPAEIDGFTEDTIPGAVLTDFVNKAREDRPIKATGDGASIKFQSSRTNIRLASLPGADFPVWGDRTATHHFSISAKLLRETLEKVGKAVSSEEARYYLNGIHMHHDGAGKLVFVATDGHRLIKRTMDAPDGTDESMPAIIIPRFCLAAVTRLLADMEKSDTPVTINFSENQIQVQTSAATITSKLIDGTFPDYQRVIPAGNPHVYRIRTALMKSALERISTLPSGGRSVAFEFGAGKLSLTLRNGTGDEIEDALDIDGSDEAVRIGFNARYMLDLLSVIDTDSFEIELKGPSDPGRIVPCGSEELESVIMPARA